MSSSLWANEVKTHSNPEGAMLIPASRMPA